MGELLSQYHRSCFSMHDWTQCTCRSCFVDACFCSAGMDSEVASPKSAVVACQDAGLSSALARLLDARRCLEELLVRKVRGFFFCYSGVLEKAPVGSVFGIFEGAFVWAMWRT